MKIKNHEQWNKIFSSSSTRVIEWCDGVEDVLDMRISHYENGIINREDGPAIEYWDGTKRWFLNGSEYRSEADWKIEVKKRKETHFK